MEAKIAKELNRVALNLKRKQATRYAAHLSGASQPMLGHWSSLTSPASRAVKRMRLGGYRNRLTNAGRHIGRSLARRFLNYKKSGRLERLMFYENGEWLDFPKDVVDLVKKDLEVKKAAVEIESNGYHLLFDFLHLHKKLKIALTKRTGNVGEDIQQHQDIDLDAYTESVYGILDLNSVQKMFLKGMSSFGSTDSDIFEIYQCSGASMQARWELFQKQAEISKKNHGEANIQYDWLASSKGELSTMMNYGLSHYGLSGSKCTYDIGVHLAAVTCPDASLFYPCPVLEGPLPSNGSRSRERVGMHFAAGGSSNQKAYGMFTSLRTKHFPSVTRIMRPFIPAWTTIHGRQFSASTPQIVGSNYRVNCSCGVIRKDIMQWMLHDNLPSAS
ncbi:hypothetical protein JHK86_000137 [Glycine max]|nr:hypothetical protein JHK86_000137 [Glycine max]